MICPQCEKENKKSKIRKVKFTMITKKNIVGLDVDPRNFLSNTHENFYDEEGRKHHHLINVNISFYKCTNNHNIKVIGEGFQCCPVVECNKTEKFPFIEIF